MKKMFPEEHKEKLKKRAKEYWSKNENKIKRSNNYDKRTN